MGLFAYAVASGGFILIGAWESMDSSNVDQNPSPTTNPSSPITPTERFVNLKPNSDRSSPLASSSSPLSFIAIAVLSFMFALNSIVSLFSALSYRDRVGSVQQLQVLVIAALFLLYSILGLLSSLKSTVSFPASIKGLILVFGFIEEFYLFYAQKKDTNGVENRYFDLILVPISICLFATILELRHPMLFYPKFARATGLILQGSWFIQMGLSFYTSLMANGCSLHEKSRGNFTIKCKGHSDYHRARAIATLQFNCHLALMVILAVVLYSIFSYNNGDRSGFSRYRPIGAEMNQVENMDNFALESDEEDGMGDERSLAKEEGSSVELNVNGFRS